MVNLGLVGIGSRVTIESGWYGRPMSVGETRPNTVTCSLSGRCFPVISQNVGFVRIWYSLTLALSIARRALASLGMTLAIYSGSKYSFKHSCLLSSRQASKAADCLAAAFVVCGVPVTETTGEFDGRIISQINVLSPFSRMKYVGGVEYSDSFG